MKVRGALILGFLGLVSLCRGADDTIDRLDDLLTLGTSDGQIRARISGTLELEGYAFPQPAPALIDAEGTTLFNPRLITFVDFQAGSWLYAFAQLRVDRGFDPSDDRVGARLDEYAIRFTPGRETQLNFQIGKFATVVGNWVARHGAWDNPFVGAPLAYEELTAIWDQAAARNLGTLVGWSRGVPPAARGVPAADKYLRLPIIWGPSYATGFAVSGRVGHATYAAEVKNAPLASRPDSWAAEELRWRHPTVSGRVGYVPNQMWNLGFSISDGVYLLPEAQSSLPVGQALGNYRQTVFAQDLGFAWHHWQLWAEMFEARFSIPRVGDADTFSYYVETKYKFTPQWFGAVRWNEQRYAKIPNGTAGSVRWGTDTWRADLASGYRFTPHTQLKIQYSVQHEDAGPREYLHAVSAQLLLRF